MATNELPPGEARALRAIEAIHGGPEDVDDDAPFDPAAIARMRLAVDAAFERARVERERVGASDRAPTRPAGLLELAGDALRARIAALKFQLGAQLQLAHRSLEEMSDDDLRSLLSDIEDYAAHVGAVP